MMLTETENILAKIEFEPMIFMYLNAVVAKRCWFIITKQWQDMHRTCCTCTQSCSYKCNSSTVMCVLLSDTDLVVLNIKGFFLFCIFIFRFLLDCLNEEILEDIKGRYMYKALVWINKYVNYIFFLTPVRIMYIYIQINLLY